MEKDLVDGKLGTVGSYDVEFKEGKLRATVKAEAGPLAASVVVELSADATLDAIAKAIPGTLDDALLGLLKTALKA